MFTKNSNFFLRFYKYINLKFRIHSKIGKSILKNEVIYSILFFTTCILYKIFLKPNKINFSHITSMFFLGSILILPLNYIINRFIIKYYKQKSLKSALSLFIESTNKIDITDKIKE